MIPSNQPGYSGMYCMHTCYPGRNPFEMKVSFINASPAQYSLRLVQKAVDLEKKFSLVYEKCSQEIIPHNTHKFQRRDCVSQYFTSCGTLYLNISRRTGWCITVHLYAYTCKVPICSWINLSSRSEGKIQLRKPKNKWKEISRPV